MRKYLTQATTVEAINRLEDAARTEDEFGELVEQLDVLGEKKQKAYYQKMLYVETKTVDWFCYKNNMLKDNDILTLLFGCVCQMHNLIEDDEISWLVNKATDKQKHIFFLNIIRGCSPQQIAHCLEMTDRNVRDMTDKMIRNVQKGLIDLLTRRQEDNILLTIREKAFLDMYGKKTVDE